MTTVVGGKKKPKNRKKPAPVPALERSFQDVTDKQPAIAEKLKPEVQAKLDQRLRSADKATADQIKDLLHFSRRSHGATTPAIRLSIRVALSAYLAHGGDIRAAEGLKAALQNKSDAEITAMLNGGDSESKKHLKETLPGRSDAEIAAMLNGLNQDKRLPLGMLSQGLLNQRSPTARRDFSQLRQVLTTFPPDPGRANSIELIDNNVTIGRDATGHLVIKNHALAFAQIGIPPSNRGLTRADVEALKQDFRTLANQKYSTQGVALDFMEFFRTENARRAAQGRPALTMAQAFAQFNPNGATASNKYSHGDCMCHAEKLKATIEGKGYQVQVIGMYNTTLTTMTDPSGGKEKVQIAGADQVTEGITHTDLMIPFTDDRGNRKVLILAPGAGPGDNYIREFALDASGGLVIPDDDHKFAQLRRVAAGPAIGMDATQLQRAQFKFRHNLQMKNSEPGLPKDADNLVGIDMLAGTIYLNGRASKQFVAQHGSLPGGVDPANVGSISFDFKDAFAHPFDRVTIQVWNNDANSYVPRQIMKIQSLHVFLRLVQRQFGQPDAWLQNTISLLAHRDEYNTEILLPSLNTGAQTHALAKSAFQARPHPNAPERAEYNRLLVQAGDAVQDADTATASACYAEAAVLADRVAADAIVRRLPPGSAAQASAQASRQQAAQAIAAGDPATATRHLQTLTRDALVALGVGQAALLSASTVRALADFPIAENAATVNKIVAIDGFGRDPANSISNEVAGLVANIAKQSPNLADRLHALAVREQAGLERRGITEYMATRARFDQFMSDHTSPMASRPLPTAAALGFAPKYHITLPEGEYRAFADLARRLKDVGLLRLLSIDDAARTVHVGYTYQTLMDILLGATKRPQPPRAPDMNVVMDANNLRRLLANMDKLNNDPQEGLFFEEQFGNPAHQAARQMTRFEAMYNMYVRYNDFDFAAYDLAYSDIVRAQLAQSLQGKMPDQQMTELLNRYRGFVIGDQHPEAEMKQALYDSLPHLAAQGVRVIGIEHLREAGLGDMLREYFAQPPGSPMRWELETALAAYDSGYDGAAIALYGNNNTPRFFQQMIQRAKQLNIQVVPLDTDSNRASKDAVYDGETRFSAMNTVAENQLRAALATQPPDAKYVLLAGKRHNNTHPGLTRGAPGLAQVLGIPAVEVELDMDASNTAILLAPDKAKLHLVLDRENKANRRPATEEAPN
jgi:hypothetical protein